MTITLFMFQTWFFKFLKAPKILVLDKTLKGTRGVRLDNRKVFSYTRS